MLVFPSVRDFVLYPWWPPVWREVGTARLVGMIQREYPHNVTAVKCSFRTKSSVQSSNRKLFSNMLYMTKPSFPETNLTLMKNVYVRSPDHRLFFPAMTRAESETLLYIYLVLKDALDKVKVDHFLEGGSMLGALRHRGFIPWDDDLDIAISVKDWIKVREALSCITEFHLRVQTNMHWAFRRSTHRFPYIDIFFYAEDDQFIWAHAYYIMRMTFVLPKADVFPLTTGSFEGINVPLPRRSEHLAGRMFSRGFCLSPDAHHRDHKELPHRRNLPCRELQYLYKTINTRI